MKSRFVFGIAGGLAMALLGMNQARADTFGDIMQQCTQKLATGTLFAPGSTEPLTLTCQGMASYLEHDHAKAHALFLQAAQAGYAPAQEFVAEDFEHGEGVTQDYAQALDWYLKAANQGEADAENNYAIANYYGWDGLTADPAKAIPWFQKAAAQGNANSQTMLGEAYSEGRGVPQDYVQSAKWYTLASNQGHLHAMYALGLMYMNGQGVTRDDAAGFAWLQKSAAKHYAVAEFEVAQAYANGRGVAKDVVQADLWYALYTADNKDVRPPEMDALEKTMTSDQLAAAKTARLNYALTDAAAQMTAAGQK